MRKWTRSSLGTNGPKAAVEVVVEVEEAEVAEVDVGEEEETGKRPDLNLTLRILVNTLIRELGSNCLQNR